VATQPASTAAALMPAGRGLVDALALRMAWYSRPRNQGSYSHQGQQRQTNLQTERHKETHWHALGVLPSAVVALQAGQGPDAFVAIEATGFGPKAAHAEHAEGRRKGSSGGGISIVDVDLLRSVSSTPSYHLRAKCVPTPTRSCRLCMYYTIY
jgi:hypothetical protein